MTSARQIAANRRNARKSTGPRTEHGKRSSSRNALRHGLTAEKLPANANEVVDYQVFEARLLRELDPRSILERQLCQRLTSLLWRLQRAVTIEAGLMDIQRDILRGQAEAALARAEPTSGRQSWVEVMAASATVLHQSLYLTPQGSPRNPRITNGTSPETKPAYELTSPGHQEEIARVFLRLANLDNEIFERLGRYETRLWRSALQAIHALAAIRRTHQPERDCS